MQLGFIRSSNSRNEKGNGKSPTKGESLFEMGTLFSDNQMRSLLVPDAQAIQERCSRRFSVCSIRLGCSRQGASIRVNRWRSRMESGIFPLRRSLASNYISKNIPGGIFSARNIFLIWKEQSYRMLSAMAIKVVLSNAPGR